MGAARPYQVAGAAEAFVARAARLNIPATVTFQITDRCNYRCAHCYETHEARDELTTDEVVGILGQLAEAGVLFLTLTGGEVYMRPDLDAILAAARALRFAVRLFTTGHHVDEARADRLAELAIQEVHLSLYGADAGAHEAVTGMPGSFERTLAAARRLRARNLLVVLKTPVLSVNVRRHAALSALAASLGCALKVDPKLTVREDGDRSPLHLRVSADDLADFYSTFAPDESAARAGRYGEPLDLARANQGSPCRIARASCAINPQGLVFGCIALPVPAGDLRRERFLDVWRGSPKLRQLRDITWGDIAVCNSCTLRRFCSRCNAMALLEDGNLLGPSTEACRNAVALRESLRARGLVPADTSTELPAPLRDGAAPERRIGERLAYGYRPSGLRVIG